jgi:hypothetical protein
LYEAEGGAPLPSCTDRQSEGKEKQHVVNVREGVKVYCHSFLHSAIEELTCHTDTTFQKAIFIDGKTRISFNKPAVAIRM